MDDIAHVAFVNAHTESDGCANYLQVIVNEIALYLLLVTQRIPYLIAFVGGLFFMLSDTLLTGQQYRKELKHGNFYVMSTYIIAQSLLVLGLALTGGN